MLPLPHFINHGKRYRHWLPRGGVRPLGSLPKCSDDYRICAEAEEVFRALDLSDLSLITSRQIDVFAYPLNYVDLLSPSAYFVIASGTLYRLIWDRRSKQLDLGIGRRNMVELLALAHTDFLAKSLPEKGQHFLHESPELGFLFPRRDAQQDVGCTGINECL